MPTYTLHLPPEEVVRLIRAEVDAARGAPHFYVNAFQDYTIEEDYDRKAHGVTDSARYDLVTAEAVLKVEPQVEHDYWVLAVRAHRTIGPRIVADENVLIGEELSLEAFEHTYLAPCHGRVLLEAPTQQARQHFNRWWAELTDRHSGNHPEVLAEPVADEPAPVHHPETHRREGRSGENGEGREGWSYRAREAVGVFATPEALQSAVDQLLLSGFDRAGLSVLGTDTAVKAQIGRFYRSVAEVEDESRVPRSAYVSQDSRVEGQAATVAVPLYIGGIAGAAAIVASGGALAVAIGGAIGGAAAGAGLGALLARAVARHHADRVAAQLARGGLVLWVTIPDRESERQAVAALRKAGARDIHVHELQRQWGPDQRPLAETQPDPFLEDPRSGP